MSWQVNRFVSFFEWYKMNCNLDTNPGMWGAVLCLFVYFLLNYLLINVLWKSCRLYTIILLSAPFHSICCVCIPIFCLVDLWNKLANINTPQCQQPTWWAVCIFVLSLCLRTVLIWSFSCSILSPTIFIITLLFVVTQVKNHIKIICKEAPLKVK